MSAYLCEPKHIAYLARYYVEKSNPGQDCADMAMVLAQANLDSLGARYGDDTENAEYIAECRQLAMLATWQEFKPLQVIKAARCYEYQACEVEGFESTAAGIMTARILSNAIGKLPGYDAALWGAPEPMTGACYVTA